MKNKEGLWKLSPSGLYGFSECKSCFWVDNNYKKAATIISWLYGASSERWRHILSAQKKSKPPKEVEEFLKKFRKPKKK